MCLSSARMALFRVHPNFSKNVNGTSAEISSRGLHNPRMAPLRFFDVDILKAAGGDVRTILVVHLANPSLYGMVGWKCGQRAERRTL